MATADARAAREQAEILEALVRRFASTTPRDGEWESSYRALQQQARRVLAQMASGAGAHVTVRSPPARSG